MAMALQGASPPGVVYEKADLLVLLGENGGIKFLKIGNLY